MINISERNSFDAAVAEKILTQFCSTTLWQSKMYSLELYLNRYNDSQKTMDSFFGTKKNKKIQKFGTRQ